MIQSFTLENFGPIQCMEAKNLGKINLILAENSKGKTFILKALYSVIKSHEEAHKGKNNRSFEEELRDKLYWTFQVDKIGDLVSKGSLNVNNHQLKMNLTLEDNTSTVFSFGPRTEKEIKLNLSNLTVRKANSIFLPPKEVLSLFQIIKDLSFEKLFSFDATYSDLVNALDLSDEFNEFNKLSRIVSMLEFQASQLKEIYGNLNQIGLDENNQDLIELDKDIQETEEYIKKAKHKLNATNTPDKFSNFKKLNIISKDIDSIIVQLERIFQGSVKFNKIKKHWIYRQNNYEFSINITAEGIKKISILETLLQNGFLTSGSIIFIDEPESNLHPKAISQFLDILFELSQAGMQIFMATHSYFVIKKMHLLARQHNESVPVLMSKDKDGKTIWIQEDLIDGMPENEIINESIRLFKEETDLIMDW